MNLVAYHGKPAEKAEIIKQLRAHAKADQLIQGYGYWAGGKGCAVGCTLHRPEGGHAEYEPQFGIPEILARLEDQIFEGLPKEEARKWPVAFMLAIKPGADLSDIWPQFAIWLLADPKKGVIRFAKTDAQRAAIDGVAELYRKRVPRGDLKWALARRAAYAAADDAYASAAADAYASAAAYAADAAAYAAYAAAYAADAYASAAADDAYASAADAAADAYAYATSAAADDAYASAAAARKIHWQACATKLLELLRKAPMAR